MLVGFGAKVNDLIDQGQYWRLITCIFLHIGLLHLFFNNYALWIIGQEIERFYGSSRFVLIYLLTGMAGSTASYLFSPSDSAGASGAIFGLFGVMVTFPYRYRKEIPDALRKGIIRSMLPVILLNLGLGFTVPMIDQSAHIGGLAAGVALALVITHKRPDERATALAWRALCVICLTSIALSFIAVFSSYKMPPLKMENLTVSPGKGVIDYWERMNLGLASLRESDEAFKPILEERSGEAASDALKKVERGIDILESSPSIDEEADSYRHRLLDLLAEQKNLLEKYNRSDDRDWNALMRERNSIIARANQFIKDFESWVSGFLA